MGGDGGVIASNRRYLRGAGTADKIGDRAKQQGNESEELECLEKMQNCALTGHAFDYKNDLIVTCAFGNLYKREASIEALLSLLSSEESPSSGLGKHIRKLKDLVPVYFNLVKDSNGKYVPTCPITNVEFNGKQPAFVIVKKQKKKEKDNKAVEASLASSDEQEENKVNVLSERAMKEIGMESLQLEYGPFEKDDIIRLAPSSRDLIQIKQEYERRCENNMNNNKKGKKKKNRKKKRKDTTEEENTVAGVSNNDSNRKKKKKNSSSSSGGDAASQARSNVTSSISSNSVFSSIFKSSAEVSEKEKKDNLFAR